MSILAQLAHPFVIGFYGISKCRNVELRDTVAVSIVMEFAPGSLDSALRAPVDERWIGFDDKAQMDALMRVAAEIAAAMGYTYLTPA